MPLSTTSRYRPAEIPHLLHDLSHGRAAAAATHKRNNAKRTAIVAAVLNFEIGPRPIAARVFHRRGQEIALCENIAHADFAVIGNLLRLAHNIGNLNLM
jgi:hypothetical protein